jgi:hypothetical protein
MIDGVQAKADGIEIAFAGDFKGNSHVSSSISYHNQKVICHRDTETQEKIRSIQAALRVFAFLIFHASLCLPG